MNVQLSRHMEHRSLGMREASEMHVAGLAQAGPDARSVKTQDVAAGIVTNDYGVHGAVHGVHGVVADASISKSTECNRCPAGTFASFRSHECSLCPTGRASGTESEKCTVCPAGKFATESSWQCEQCEGGSYSNSFSGSCSDCPAGRYAGVGSTECVKCEAGQFSNVKASSSVICVEGNFSAEGAYRCEACPEGKTSMVKGTKSSDDCICEKGSYARNASVICQSCGALKWIFEFVKQKGFDWARIPQPREEWIFESVKQKVTNEQFQHLSAAWEHKAAIEQLELSAIEEHMVTKERFQHLSAALEHKATIEQLEQLEELSASIVQRCLEMQSRLPQRSEQKRRSLEMLELPTTGLAELFQAGLDVVDDPAVQELREEILHRCVAMQANLSQRLEEKRTSLDALCGVTADDFRAEIAQECLVMESQLVQRLGELATSGQSFKFDHLWR